MLNTTVGGGKYYGELLAGEELSWWDMSGGSEEEVMTMEKDPETLIWTANIRGEKYIDTYDIIPSGHYYQNQTTTRHDPDKENFLRPETPALKGVFDLEEQPDIVTVDSEEYRNIERPFEGRWLKITMTDIGYVVYDYPDYDDGKAHNPEVIDVNGNMLALMTPFELHETLPFEEIMFWPGNASYCLRYGTHFYYSFTWKDKARGIAQWTQYYDDEKRIWQQDLFIRADLNTFPVILYDWE